MKLDDVQIDKTLAIIAERDELRSKLAEALAELAEARGPAMYFNGVHLLGGDGARTCAVCSVALPGSCYEYDGAARRYVCDACHKICSGVLPRDKVIALLQREVFEVSEEIAAWRSVGEAFIPFFHGERTELRHIEEAVVIFTRMRALLTRTQLVPASPTGPVPKETT